MKINQTHSKEIIALNTFEAVRLRPGMYLGQVSLAEEKLPIIKDNKIQNIDKKWSPGFNHLIVEILENALDEAKRMKGKMKNIFIKINLDTNEIIIKDEGDGFHDAHKKHNKTKKNVVRTAFEELHAGSNFSETEKNILGTNGVGSAVCNILSKKFKVTTVNKNYYVHYEWDDFKVIREDIHKRNKEKIGTEVSFIPTTEVFNDYKWDEEILKSYLSYKQFLISIDPVIKNLKLNISFIKNNIEEIVSIDYNFLPKELIRIDNKIGTLIMWPSYENSGSLSFINGSQCTGIHQKIVNDWINLYFDYPYAHHFYETLISLNVPSNLMRFADQNKTKYDLTRTEIEQILDESFKGKLLRLLKDSNVAKQIEKNIEERLYDDNIKKIKKAQKTSKRKISDKYSPASKIKESIFITEGLCLEENTKIFIIRKNKILFKKIKYVKKGDLVITHNNCLQPIQYKNKSIKKGIKIIIKDENIICSENHKWFIYDKIKNEFYFEETKNLNSNNHKLVKNYLTFLSSFYEIKNLIEENNKIKIINNNDEEWYVTKTNKICVFDKNKFMMKNCQELKKGDILCKFYL